MEERNTVRGEHIAGAKTVVSHATCTESGVSQIGCTVCGTVLSSENVAPSGHSWSEWKNVSSASCKSAGVEERTCAACGSTEHKETGSGGHSAGAEVIVKEASCTETGLKQIKCSVCGTVLSEESIAKKGHSWSGWTVTTVATCEVDGEETRTCSVCPAVETRVVEATGHNMEWITIEMPKESCEHVEIGTCSCGYEEEKRTESHLYEDHDHDNYDINFDMGTGTVTCLKKCSRCSQTDPNPLHESCEVSIGEDGALRCACGFDIPN